MLGGQLAPVIDLRSDSNVVLKRGLLLMPLGVTDWIIGKDVEELESDALKTTLGHLQRLHDSQTKRIVRCRWAGMEKIRSSVERQVK